MDIAFSTLVAIELPSSQETHVEISIGDVKARSSSKQGSDIVWDDVLRLSVDEATFRTASLDMAVVGVGTARTKLSTLSAALGCTKQLTLDLGFGGAIACSVVVTKVPQPAADEVVVAKQKPAVKRRVVHQDPDDEEATTWEQSEAWPLTDAFVAGAVDRYVAECERAGVKAHGLRGYREYLSSPEAQQGLKAEVAILEGPEPTSPVVAKAYDRGEAAYAVARARGEPSVRHDDVLVSPRRYTALRNAVFELSADVDERPVLSTESTYPWEAVFDEPSGQWFYRNAETKATTWDAPKKMWERKLELLTRVKKAGHVARRAERTRNIVDPPDGAVDRLLRKERRLDAVVDGWEWEEDEREARRRRYARRTNKENKQALLDRRAREPTDDEAIADALVALVTNVVERSTRDDDDARLARRRLERRSWHPACGARHMRRNCLANLVDVDYVAVHLTTAGEALASAPLLCSESHSQQPRPRLRPLSDDNNKSLSHRQVPKVVLRCTALVELKLSLAVPIPRSDAFEAALRLDAARAAGFPVTRVSIEELATLRRDATTKPPRLRASWLLSERRRALGWSSPESKNLVVAKLSLIGDESVFEAAERLALQAADETSPLRRRGTVACCAIGATTRRVESLGPSRTWAQHWVHIVSPVYFGRSTRLKVDDRAKQKLSAQVVDSSDDDEAGPESLAPATGSSRLERLKRKACEADLVVESLSKGKKVYDMCGREQVTRAQLTARRAAERATSAMRSAAEKDRRRIKKVEWWQRPVTRPHTLFDATRFAQVADDEALARRTSRALAKIRTQKEAQRANRVRAARWRARKWAMQTWLVRKLSELVAPIDPDAFYAALNLATNQRVGESAAAKKAQTKAIDESLRWLHSEVSEDTGSVVTKRDLFTSICEPPLVHWATTDEAASLALAPLLVDNRLATCLFAAPVATSGELTADELAIFGLVVHDVYPLYRQALADLHEEDTWPENDDEPTQIPDEEEEESKESEVEDEASSSSDEDDDVKLRWHAQHTHIFVRTSFHSGPYCCLCRRRRHMERSERAARKEEAWVERDFAMAKASRLAEVTPDVEASVDASRAVERVRHVERTTVVLAVRDVMTTILDALDRDTTIQSIVTAMTSVVACAEARDDLVKQQVLEEVVARPLLVDYSEEAPTPEDEGRSSRKLAVVAREVVATSIFAAHVDERSTLIREGLDALSAQLDEQERERRAMVADERNTRAHIEGLEAAVEAASKSEQETGQRSFQTTIAHCAEVPEFARLRWIETVSLDANRGIHACVDPANGTALFARFLALQHESDVEHVLAAVEAIRSAEHRGVVKIASAHSFFVEGYNLLGTCFERWHLVAILSLRSGKQLVDILNPPQPARSIDGETEAAIRRSVLDYRRSLTDPTVDATRFQAWMRDVAASLAHVHSRDVLHRNLHPGAVFVDEVRGGAVLDDFQVTKEARRPHCPYSLGRVDYGGEPGLAAAPEVDARDHRDGQTGAPADVWAFGCCMLAWTLGGRVPYAIGNDVDGALRHLLQDLPARFATGPIPIAIEFALRPDPTKRATAVQLARILEAGLPSTRRL